MEAVLLLRQCPPGIAENFAVAIRDMNAALLEKQLARASAAPLEEKTTGHEAALKEEVDAAVKRREAIEAEDEYNDRRYYNEPSVKDFIERHS